MRYTSGMRSAPDGVGTLLQISRRSLKNAQKLLLNSAYHIRYRINFLDHDGIICATCHVEHDDDEEAIEAPHRLYVLARPLGAEQVR